MRKIASPPHACWCSDRAVATSGNYRRGVDIGGQHYSHIVDPRTGRTGGRDHERDSDFAEAGRGGSDGDCILRDDTGREQARGRRPFRTPSIC